MSESAQEPSKVTATTSDQPLADPNVNLDHKVLEAYRTRSGPRLAEIFDQLYTPDTIFEDPFAVASPLSEARLQFLSLQHLFSSITATAYSTTTSGNETRMDVHFDYYWARNSWFTRMILPEVTPVDAVVVLQHDPTTGKIMKHVDDWKSPAIRALPTSVRQLNVKALNSVFRLLGWESELKPQKESHDSGAASAAGGATRKQD